MKLRFREDHHLPKVTQQGRAELDLNAEFRSIWQLSHSHTKKKKKTIPQGGLWSVDTRLGIKSPGIRWGRFKYWLCHFLVV